MRVSLLKKVLNKLNGVKYPQDYLCLSLEKFDRPLNVYYCSGNNVIKNVSSSHLFIGYKPLIIAIPAADVNFAEDIELVFSDKENAEGTTIEKANRIASLVLNQVHKVKAGDTYIGYYEGVNGQHHFLNSIHKYIYDLQYRLYSDRNTNIYLDANLNDQVHIAYALPRKICLITVQDNKLYNLFPTDLHGQVGDYYIISLRKDGKACRQVESRGEILLSDIDVNYYKQVYALGKNHMKEFREKAEFNFTSHNSKIFNLPLPDGAIGYKELRLQSFEVHGIHKLFLFKIMHNENKSNLVDTLSHVHACYATWRYHRRIDTQYFLR